MTAPIPDEVAIAALELVLKPLGTSLRHYEPRHKVAAIEAMRGVLMAERERETERCIAAATADACGACKAYGEWDRAIRQGGEA